jgi:AraC-like DNA-binding protein
MPRAPQHQPASVTPMAFARAIAAVYRRYERDASNALKLAQLTQAQLAKADARITAHQLEVLTAAAMQELDDEGLGAFERRLPWGSYGMLARASLTAPTLGVALKRWCRHHGLLTDGVRLAVSQSGATAAITVEEAWATEGELRELSLAFLLRNAHGLACWFADSRIPLTETLMPFPAPPHADAYRFMFPGPLRFDAPRAEVRFDARYLALPLRRDEKALAAMLQRALPVTVLQYRRDRLLVRQVRQALVAHPDAAHNAAGIAELLNVSPRTLHRQLKEEGATLQQLKDDVRCEHAKDLLYRTNKPLKQVAAAVGFRNEKSFSRAFRLWTGTTPALFRDTRT